VTANHAWMLKGWLLGANAPSEIMEAVDQVIASLTTLPSPPHVPARAQEDEQPSAPLEGPAEENPEPEKRRREWSPEARAAAAERMKARQAAGLMARRRPGDRPPPGEAPAPSMGGAETNL
jgi:hypothetical protein